MAVEVRSGSEWAALTFLDVSVTDVPRVGPGRLDRFVFSCPTRSTGRACAAPRPQPARTRTRERPSPPARRPRSRAPRSPSLRTWRPVRPQPQRACVGGGASGGGGATLLTVLTRPSYTFARRAAIVHATLIYGMEPITEIHSGSERDREPLQQSHPPPLSANGSIRDAPRIRCRVSRLRVAFAAAKERRSLFPPGVLHGFTSPRRTHHSLVLRDLVQADR